MQVGRVTAGAESLPPLPAVQAALRKTTETLVREAARPATQPPPWSDEEWRIARAAASLHGISPLLARLLSWRGPPGWSRFVHDQRAQTLTRQLRMQRLLAELDVTAGAAGLPFVALKGAALHNLGLYEPGDRPMADLDILARPQCVAAFTQILVGMGFRQTGASWKNLAFEQAHRAEVGTFGEHGENVLKIDLHTQIVEALPWHRVDASGLMFPATPRPGLNPYASRSALMVHLLLHAAGSISFRQLRLVQLHDLGLLARHMTQVDWEQLQEQAHAHGGLWWTYPPLALVSRYYSAIPAPLLRAAETSCRGPLRQAAARQLLSEVSYSDLRRFAFPAIGWAQTWAEVPAYVVQRTLLSVRALAGSLRVPDPAAAGAAPRPRGLRWIGLRPARPATLHAVCAALAAGP